MGIWLYHHIRLLHHLQSFPIPSDQEIYCPTTTLSETKKNTLFFFNFLSYIDFLRENISRYWQQFKTQSCAEHPQVAGKGSYSWGLWIWRVWLWISGCWEECRMISGKNSKHIVPATKCKFVHPYPNPSYFYVPTPTPHTFMSSPQPLILLCPHPYPSYFYVPTPTPDTCMSLPLPLILLCPHPYPS